MRLALWVPVFVLFFGCGNVCDAGEDSSESRSLPRDPFRRGATEIELRAGAFFSVDSGYSSRPTINLALESVRFGIMLTDPHGSGLLAGNAELLLEAMAGEIFTGPGTAIDGASLFLRYNFLHPHSRMVPYLQIGVGGAYNDIVHSESQALIGSESQVLLQGDIGVRLMLNERFSFMVESGVLHLSNAGSTERNHGLNCLGGSAGISFSF